MGNGAMPPRPSSTLPSVQLGPIGDLSVSGPIWRMCDGVPLSGMQIQSRPIEEAAGAILSQDVPISSDRTLILCSFYAVAFIMKVTISHRKPDISPV